NLEDVRHAKSAISSGLLMGELTTAAYGASNGDDRHHNETVALAGLGAAAASLLLKDTAHADTRHAEFLPQRVYVVPVNITSPGSAMTLEVPSAPGSRLVLPAIDPPSNSSDLQLRYVRMHPMDDEP